MVNAQDVSNVDGVPCSENWCSNGERRSKRKKSSHQGPISTANSVRNISKFKTGSTTTCLTNLPHLVLFKLLQFLDVQSLENLSATCSLFDEMIAGQYLTSISIPFSPEFVREMKTSKSIDKKPLLKLEFGKSKRICLQTMLRGDNTIDRISHILEYLIESQLSLVDLRQLREIDLVFNTSSEITVRDMCNITDFYMNVLINPIGVVNNRFEYKYITRLHIMMGEDTIAVRNLLSVMNNLIELGLHIYARRNLSLWPDYIDYMRGLQIVVSACRAPTLKLIIHSETRRVVEKRLINGVVERLEIEGPCTANIVPVMKNLKEVVVKPKSISNTSSDICTYWKIKREDRAIHRAGLCCVNLGDTLANCPKLVQFMGVDVSSTTLNYKSVIRNLKLKKKFYKLYSAAGGSMEFKTWCKTRWISKKSS